jgi:hypothetical protein
MPEISPSRYMVQAGWNDVPHLDEPTKKEMLAAIMPHLREARSEGSPTIGAGQIYPIPLADVEVAPFRIPAYWPKAYALDVGWNKTAACWGAWDNDNDVIYIYAEHYVGQAVPAVHAAAIRARGDWIKGVIDPASRGRTQLDGAKLIEAYKAEKLKLTPADNTIDAGLNAVWQRLATGRLKFFNTCSNLKAEYRLYRRDEHGKIIKKFDHLMDALRYLILSGGAVASLPQVQIGPGVQSMAVLDSLTGY